ncbi:MAG: DUF4397 domain-containing protein [Terriglobales bacterium]|jgi:hypothetical protein
MRLVLKTLPLTLAFVLALGAVGLVTTSCNSSNTEVRFVDAISGSPEMDIFFNSGRDFTEMTFPGYQPSSGYRPVPSGNVTIEGTISGTTTEQFTASNVNLGSGSEYTVVATGTLSEPVILSPADDNTEPANGQVSFRIIDAAISSPSTVYVYILANNSNGQGPGVNSQSALTATITSPSAPTTATSGYEPQSFNSNNTGWTGYVCTVAAGTPILTFPVDNFGSAAYGSIRTIVLTDNSTATGFDSSPQILSDLH